MSGFLESPRLRPRDLGELMDETLVLYRRNFALFAGIVAVIAVPQAVLAALAVLAGNSALGTVAVVLLFITALFYIVMIAALARTISCRYLGEQTTILEAYRSIGWRTFFRLLGALIIALMVFYFSLIFLVIPAIVIAVYWLFLPQVIVLEGSNVASSLGRSWQLVKGSFWRVLGYGLVVYVSFLIVQYGISFAATFALGALGTGGTLIGGLVSAVVSVLALPFLFGAVTLLYYDLRIRKEAFDLELLARGLSLRPPA